MDSKYKELGLVLGNKYTVGDFDMGQSSTSFVLDEFPDVYFDTEGFCFCQN
jgi:hypothetical protein